MTVTLIQLLVWIVIAAVVGLFGELISRRRAPDQNIWCGNTGFSGHFPGCGGASL